MSQERNQQGWGDDADSGWGDEGWEVNEPAAPEAPAATAMIPGEGDMSRPVGPPIGSYVVIAQAAITPTAASTDVYDVLEPSQLVEVTQWVQLNGSQWRGELAGH